MSKSHVVKLGDHVPRLAAANGFGETKDVWDDPGNAALKDKGRTPCILAVDDVVTIPDKKPKVESAPTGEEHAFVVKRPKVRLRVVIKDRADKPVKDTPCTVTCKGAPAEGNLDGGGKLDTPIGLDAVEGKIEYLDRELQVLIAHLAPIDEPLGQRARLNNLGYYAGHDDAADPTDEEDPDAQETEQQILLRSAIEEFQCDSGMKATGKFDDATKKKLLAAHGC